jgi:hypothetical protein
VRRLGGIHPFLANPREATDAELELIGRAAAAAHRPLQEWSWGSYAFDDVDPPPGVEEWEELLDPLGQDDIADALGLERLAMRGFRGHVERTARRLREEGYLIALGRLDDADAWKKHILLLPQFEMPDHDRTKRLLLRSTWI